MHDYAFGLVTLNSCLLQNIYFDLSIFQTSLNQFSVHENDNTGYIIDNVFTSFPLVCWLTNYGIRCLFSLTVVVVWKHDLSNLFVR